jgi:hypothetical protein
MTKKNWNIFECIERILEKHSAKIFLIHLGCTIKTDLRQMPPSLQIKIIGVRLIHKKMTLSKTQKISPSCLRSIPDTFFDPNPPPPIKTGCFFCKNTIFGHFTSKKNIYEFLLFEFICQISVLHYKFFFKDNRHYRIF